MPSSHREAAEKDSKDNKGIVTKRLALYSLAAGSAIVGAGAQDADAAIVYSGVYNVTLNLGYALNWDLNYPDYVDIRLKNYKFGYNYYQGISILNAPGQLYLTNNGPAPFYVTALSGGELIDASSVGPTFYGALGDGNYLLTEFDNAIGKFIGLSFPIAGQTHYAWLRVNINNAAGTFTLVDWAYEDQAGVGITAGAGVPEPASLGLLAAGAMGLAGLRRRRRSA